MSKRAFEKIAAGLDDAVVWAKGRADRGRYGVHVPQEIEVKAIRARLGLSQADFASRYGLSLGCVRDWEQGRSRPDGPARAYLLVIAREPELVAKALAAA